MAWCVVCPSVGVQPQPCYNIDECFTMVSLRGTLERYIMPVYRVVEVVVMDGCDSDVAVGVT